MMDTDLDTDWTQILFKKGYRLLFKLPKTKKKWRSLDSSTVHPLLQEFFSSLRPLNLLDVMAILASTPVIHLFVIVVSGGNRERI